jgi:phospholipid transport system substrate-binding protein
MSLRTIYDRYRDGLVTALVLTMPVALVVAAAPPPSEQVRNSMAAVIEVLKDPELRESSRAAERRAALRRIVAELFDYDEMTRRALGPHWAERTPAERKEMVRLFRELLERAYLGELERYSGERIVFTTETVDGDVATVGTRVMAQGGSDIPIDYRLLLRGDRWRAWDLTIDGASLVSNYRGQFDRIVKAASYEELVRRLRTKLEEPAARTRKPLLETY